MTQKMNKPRWASDCKECMNLSCEIKKNIDKVQNTICICREYQKERVLNPDIAEFFYATNERFKQCGKQ